MVTFSWPPGGEEEVPTSCDQLGAGHINPPVAPRPAAHSTRRLRCHRPQLPGSPVTTCRFIVHSGHSVIAAIVRHGMQSLASTCIVGTLLQVRRARLGHEVAGGGGCMKATDDTSDRFISDASNTAAHVKRDGQVPSRPRNATISCYRSGDSRTSPHNRADIFDRLGAYPATLHH